MGRTPAGFRVLSKPVEVSSCPSSLPSLVFSLFISQTTLASIFHDPFIWSRFLFLSGTSSLPPAPQPHSTPSCSSSRLLRLALPSICSHCLVMLEPFPAFPALPAGGSQQATPWLLAWPPWRSQHHVLCSLLPARVVQRMHRTLNQQHPAVSEAPRQQRLLHSPPPSSPHRGLSRRLGQGRAWLPSGSYIGECVPEPTST